MRRTTVLVVGVVVTGLAGCAVEQAATAEPTASASPTPSPTPTPTPSPTPAEVTASDLSDPDGAGIVFVDIPDLRGPAAAAHDAVARTEVETWRSQKEGAISPGLASTVSPSQLTWVESLVQRDREAGWGYEGALRVTISDVVVDGATATASVCEDYADVRFTMPDAAAPLTLEQAEYAQFVGSAMTLASPDGGATWRVEEAEFTVGC